MGNLDIWVDLHYYLQCGHTEGGTTGRMLCKSYRRTYVGPPDVCYFLEYSLINTWMYKATFGLLSKNHRDVYPLAGHPLLFGPINTPLTPSCFTWFLDAPKLSECSQSVLSVDKR